MIGTVLPPTVVTEHAYGDRSGALYPEEEAVVARAVDKRRNEFRTTRLCARAALARLGAPAGVILSGHRGAPRWPDGVVGSMTHCDGYRAAAVTWAGDLAALGIDAETDAPLPEGVIDLLTVPSEQPHLASLPTGPGVHWDRLLFSAKESVFKAWYPVTGRELSFKEAELTVDPGIDDGSGGAPVSGTFSVRLLVGDHPFGPVLPGRWARGHGLLVTSVAVTPAALV